MTVPSSAAKSVAKHKAKTVAPKHALIETESGQVRVTPGNRTRDAGSGDGSVARPPVPATGGKKSGKKSGLNIKGFKTPASALKYRHLITAELIVGSIVILTQNTSDDSDTSFSDTVRQEAYWLVAFFFLSVLTSAGPTVARTAATMGGLILLGLLLKHKDTITTKLTPTAKKSTANK
jgi:hypothetical protein